MNLELARHQWADGRRALDRARADRPRYDRLSAAVDVILLELSRRIGQVFTLDELADSYDASDRWTLAAVHDALPDDAPAEISLAAGAAYDLYARRASDYTP